MATLIRQNNAKINSSNALPYQAATGYGSALSVSPADNTISEASASAPQNESGDEQGDVQLLTNQFWLTIDADADEADTLVQQILDQMDDAEMDADIDAYEDAMSRIDKFLMSFFNDNVPITAFELDAGILDGVYNELPTVTATIPCGFDIETEIRSPIINIIKSRQFNLGKCIHCQLIHYTDTDGEQVIFDGFFTAFSLHYSISGLHLTMSIQHWLMALDLSPAISGILTISSDDSYANALLSMLKTGVDVTVRGAQNPFIEDIIKKVKQADATNSDLIETVIRPALDFIHQEGIQKLHNLTELSKRIESAVPFDELIPSGYKINDIIRSKMHPGDLESDEPPQYNLFPKLPIRPIQLTNEATLRASFIKSLFLNSPLDAMNKSFLSLLLLWGRQYSFIVIPRVDDVRFIPDWRAPAGLKPELISDVISASYQDSVFKPISTVVAMPHNLPVAPTLDATQENQPKPPSNVTTELNTSLALSGVYRDKEKVGVVDIVRVPAWIVDEFMPKSAKSGQPIADGSQDDSVANLFAQEAYWNKRFQKSHASIVLPIRFDICPGSTVRVKMSDNDGDSATELFYDGFVTHMRTIYDSAKCVATTEYSLSHLRTADSEESESVGWKEHVYYDVKPFLAGSWVKK